MKNNIYPGLIFCLLIVLSIYQVFISPVGKYHTIILICAWLFLLRLFYMKKYREIRRQKYGTSNIFVALFKKDKTDITE